MTSIDERAAFCNKRFCTKFKCFGSWSLKAQVTIMDIITRHPEADYAEIKRLLRKAYPWGRRNNYPYKAWIRAQSFALNAILDYDLEQSGAKKQADQELANEAMAKLLT